MWQHKQDWLWSAATVALTAALAGSALADDGPAKPAVEAASVDPTAAGAAAPEAAGPRAAPGRFPTPESDEHGPLGPAGTDSRSSADEQAPEISDVRASAFRGVTPGVTTLDELTQRWGEPSQEQEDEGRLTRIYRFQPFARVEAIAEQGRVASIVLHLAEPADPAEVAGQLGLSAFQPAAVADDQGQILGRVYPERGVLFSFAEDVQELRVTHLILEPISAEAFVLRAEHDYDDRLSQNLADLRCAIRHAPHNAKAHALLAARLLRLGRFAQALASIERAIQAEPDQAEHRLTKAAIHLEQGDLEAARGELDRATAEDALSAVDAARAELLRARAFAEGPQADMKQAITHCQQAIELGVAAAKDRRFTARRAAQKTVIEAHLGAARCVAAGAFKGKEEATQRWLDQAARLAKTVVEHDHADVAKMSFWVLRETLAAYAQDGRRFALGEAAEAVLQEGRQRIEEADDPLLRRALEWELGAAMCHAMLIAAAQGNGAAAQQRAAAARELLESGAEGRDRTPAADVMLARVYFELGAAQALGAGNHAAATKWYGRAASLAPRAASRLSPRELGQWGERLVTMGVSFWEAGARPQGVELTELGLDWMQKSVARGALPEAALGAPYSNLANMHRALGNAQKASEHARLASHVEAAEEKTRRR